jgi:zinc protease
MTMTKLHWTEVDDVIAIWADAPPPLKAGLLFRTGAADENLTISGQTHLLEHLALSAVGGVARQHSGFVGGAATGFYTMGQVQEVSSFLACLCDALTSLPGDRLEDEKQILAAENAARPYDVCSNLLMWRYGATGYGRIGMPQIGLRSATIEQLHQYSAQRFTKENAVLWLSGPPPADLRLRLPHGVKQPLPPLAPIQQRFPSWFVDDACGGIAVGAMVPRVSASSLFNAIADRRLLERLRTAKAVSYTPWVYYDPLNADTAHLVLYADSHQDRRAELASEFGEVVEGLDKVDESDVENARKQLLEHWTGALAPPPADRALMDVQRAAMDWIFGKEFESFEALATEMMSVTASDVSKYGHDVQAGALFALPGKARVTISMGVQAPPSIGSAVQGREILSVDAPLQRQRLVHGPDGVSLLWPDGSHLTARYSELAAALYFDDGCVVLFSPDASSLTVEPTLWRDGQNVCRKIRERVPAHLLLDQGSRVADAIPKPRTTPWQRFRAQLTQR